MTKGQNNKKGSRKKPLKTLKEKTGKRNRIGECVNLSDVIAHEA